MFKRKTAVRTRRNLLNKRVRGVLTLSQVRALEDSGAGREEILDFLDRGYLLPIAGATTSKNTVAQGATYYPRALVVSTDITVNQGDLCYWDTTNFVLKPLSSATQVSGGFVGAAQGANVPAVYPNTPAGAPSENLPGVVVQRGGSVYVAGTSSQTYNPFQAVTIGADAQTVTSTGQTSSNRVGFIIVPPPTVAPAARGATPVPETVTGSHVELWLEPKYPDTALL